MYIFQRRTRRKGQRLPASVFKPFGRILVRKFQYPHTRFVALLLYLVAGEQRIDHGVSVLTDLLRPSAETVAVPLNILLMIGRHMGFYGTVLIGSAVQARMRTDTVTAIENLNSRFGYADVDLLLDVFIRNRVILPVNGDMVVRTYGSHLPFGKLKGSIRQRKKKSLFLFKLARPAAIPLLERLMVKGVQPFTDRCVQLVK